MMIMRNQIHFYHIFIYTLQFVYGVECDVRQFTDDNFRTFREQCAGAFTNRFGRSRHGHVENDRQRLENMYWQWEKTAFMASLDARIKGLKDAPNRFMPTFCEEIDEEPDERTLESVNKDELLHMFNYNKQNGQWTRKTKQQQEKHDFADFLLNKEMMHWTDEGASAGGTDAHDRLIKELFETLTRTNDSIRNSVFFKDPSELDDYDKELS